jgi:O-antigen ligase
MLYPVIATTMTDEKKLEKIVFVYFISSCLIILIAYYSYLFNDLSILKPDMKLMHVWHNKYARYLNSFLPFVFVLFLISRKIAFRIALVIFFIFAIISLFLSTSRGGVAGFLGIILVLLVYVSRKERINFWRWFIVIAILFIISISVLSNYSSILNRKFIGISEDIATLQGRTIAWKATIEAVQQRPLLGWGYGKKIFHKDEPFKETSFKKRPYYTEKEAFDDPHNTFLIILFHQGIIGLVSYVLMLIVALKKFINTALSSRGIKSYISIACVSVLIGNYIIHSMLTYVHFQYLVPILGLGMAANVLELGQSNKRIDIHSN